MNCLEFRRTYDIDPNCQGSAFVAHTRECDACAGFVRRASRFERCLSAAMNIKPPENLASKILVMHAFQPGLRWHKPRAGALLRWLFAASVVVAIGVGGLLFDQYRSVSLGHAVMVLVDEAEHALVPRDPVGLEDIRAALRPVGIELDDELGVVTFASPCVVRGKLAGHIVVRGEKAPISILVMPNETVSDRLTVERADLKGVLLPLSGGTIAILSAPGEELTRIESKVLTVFRWQV